MESWRFEEWPVGANGNYSTALDFLASFANGSAAVIPSDAARACSYTSLRKKELPVDSNMLGYASSAA